MASSGGIRDPRARARLAALTVALSTLAAVTLSSTSDGSGGRGVSSLSTSQLAGERIVTGFPGHQPPKRLVRAIRSGHVAGVVLFDGNFDTNGGARRLIARLQAIHRPRRLRDPLLVMVDQEGGEVKRLAGPPRLSAEEMGAAGAAKSRRQGRATAANLAKAGVNVDLAPVFDVARRGSAIGAEHRAFGSSPGRVSSTAGAFARGLASGGVVPTAKHFPGFGAAKVNTDLSSTSIGLSRKRIRKVDEAPYERADLGSRSLVMLSVATYPHFSSKPAALAHALASRELRGRVGFRGVSVSDSLDSAAAQAIGSPERIARLGAQAGTDLLLFTDYRHALAAHGAIAHAVSAGAIDRGRLVASAARVVRLRSSLR